MSRSAASMSSTRLINSINPTTDCPVVPANRDLSRIFLVKVALGMRTKVWNSVLLSNISSIRPFTTW
ncbi:hypothetical protein D3C72_2461980 [compost metagenome]